MNGKVGGGVHLPEWSSSIIISVCPFEETPGRRTDKDFAHRGTVNFTSKGVEVRRHTFLPSALTDCNGSHVCHQNFTVFWDLTPCSLLQIGMEIKSSTKGQCRSACMARLTLHPQHI
jgi:hypothetical protein